MEKRVLIAAILSGLVIVVWFTFVAPPPKKPAAPVSTPSAATAGVPTAPSTAEQAPPAPSASTAPVVPAVQGSDESDIAIAGEGLKATLTPRGGVLRSLLVEGYHDATGGALELVRADAAAPLSLVSDGPWNHELYKVQRSDKEVVLSWSDGAGNWVTKTVQLRAAGRYALDVAVQAGGRARSGVVVGVGLRDGAPGSSNVTRFSISDGVMRLDGKLDRVNPAKLDAVKMVAGNVEFAGVESQYFLLAWLPAERTTQVEIHRVDQGLAEVAVSSSGETVAGVLYAGPKDHAVLSGYGRGLQETISFGFFGFLSVAFLTALRWIHGWAGNWGLAIIVLTAGIRVLLFPLNHKSAVAMRKMQILQPKMKAIQDRYQERAKKDPQVRARMNQEVMGLYKTEGVNPMGGCLPMLVQLPILFALYSLFANAIELRQAPFIFWIKDLSIPDTLISIPLFGFVLPIRPLALLTGASMVWQQKLSPQVGDPAQRQLFMLMPLIFTIMFYSFPAGPTLYWLVNNLFTIAQQVLTQRLMARDAAKA
jgi:YidC/Oxa1 family membrane protein insertase